MFVCPRPALTFLTRVSMYLLAHAKFSDLHLYDYHIVLLASELYLQATPSSILRERINLIGKHGRSAASVANLLSSYEEWFVSLL